MDPHKQEHDVDPRDIADAYFLLDGGEARIAGMECLICHGPFGECDCFYEEAPESLRYAPRVAPTTQDTTRGPTR